MNKFHQIPTDKFIPISHDNSYLFNHFEKISNFLQFDFDAKYKNVLAKPIKNERTFDFYSVYDNLAIVPENNSNELVLIEYWKFIDLINNKINSLDKTDNENNKNWASLLAKTFNHKDNFIFTDGSNFCIVWGWKFNNNYERPIEKTIELPTEKNVIILPNEEINLQTNFEDIDEGKVELNKLNEEEGIESEDSYNRELNDIENENEINEDSNFVKFLKWIASKFWWLLWLILIIIIFLFLLKSCDQDKVYNDMNSKLIKLEQKANNCCN
jgi:hypothetical protein